MAKQRISCERAEHEFGIVANHEVMENGELRFRLMGSDGSGYIRTVGQSGSGWQKAHSHSEFRELYIVEQIWMAVAVRAPDGEPNITGYWPGDRYLTAIDEIHNIFLPDQAVIHTVKFACTNPKPQWIPDDDFTLRTQAISQAEILNIISKK